MHLLYRCSASLSPHCFLGGGGETHALAIVRLVSLWCISECSWLLAAWLAMLTMLTYAAWLP